MGLRLTTYGSGHKGARVLLPALITRFIGPTWGTSGADRTQVGPMLDPWTLLSEWCLLSVDSKNRQQESPTFVTYPGSFSNCSILKRLGLRVEILSSPYTMSRVLLPDGLLRSYCYFIYSCDVFPSVRQDWFTGIRLSEYHWNNTEGYGLIIYYAITAKREPYVHIEECIVHWNQWFQGQSGLYCRVNYHLALLSSDMSLGEIDPRVTNSSIIL